MTTALGAIRSALLVAGFAGLSLGFAATARAQDVVPLLDCVNYDAARGLVAAYFGYVSPFASAVTIVSGSSNHFSPDPGFRGQTEFSGTAVERHGWAARCRRLSGARHRPDAPPPGSA